MKLVEEAIGYDKTLELMTKMGGMYIYIPRPDTQEIEKALKANGYDSKTVAFKLGVSLSRVYKVLAQMRKDDKQVKFDLLQIPLFSPESFGENSENSTITNTDKPY
ncbi:MAG: Mor transcription activator family protein [Bacteroidales bacterium]